MSLRHLSPRLRRALLCAALFAFAVTIVGALALRTARKADDAASEKPAVIARQTEAPPAAADTRPATESETKQEAPQEVKQEARQETKREAKQDAKVADAKPATVTPREARGAKPAAASVSKSSGVGRESVEKPLGVRTVAPSLRTAEVETESARRGENRGSRRPERGEAKREEARREVARQEELTSQDGDSVNRMKNKPREERLTRAKPFNGDLRNLQRRRPVRKEKPERDGPEPRPTIRPGTPAAPDTPQPSAPIEEVAPSAPAPAPMANFAGLDLQHLGRGAPARHQRRRRPDPLHPVRQHLRRHLQQERPARRSPPSPSTPS